LSGAIRKTTIGKIPEKTGRATKKGGGGRARPKYRLSFYTGGGCIKIYSLTDPGTLIYDKKSIFDDKTEIFTRSFG